DAMLVERPRRGPESALALRGAGSCRAARFQRAAAVLDGCGAARFVLATLLAIASFSGVRAADVLTQHNDNGRTGANPAETLLSTANVKPETFGRLWTLYVDGQGVAQPLYVSQLRIDTSTNPNAPPLRGTFNAV